MVFSLAALEWSRAGQDGATLSCNRLNSWSIRIENLIQVVPMLLGVFVCVVPWGHAAQKEYVPKLAADVEKFKERRDLCNHFRGEDPYDEERGKFLAENLKKYCTGTDKELASLKAKYKNKKTVMKVLETYEEQIEAGN
jgi:hypothetical protein